MSDNTFQVELVEKDLVNVEIVEKELGNVNLKVIDVIHSIFDAQIVQDHFVYNEEPTKLSVTKFQTSKDYINGTLRVFLNGIKEVYIIEESNNTFSFEIDTVVTDFIEVSYITT